MKRLISLAAILLALSLALCACGEPEADPADDAQSSGSSEQTTQSTPPAEEPQDEGTSAGADLTALKDQFLSDYGYADYVDVETSGLGAVYGIDAGKVVASASFNASQGGAFPNEVVMVQAVDAAAAAEMQSSLESHLDDIAQQAASYDPESQALAESCEVAVCGNYVGMFFTDHCTDMTEAFTAAVS